MDWHCLGTPERETTMTNSSYAVAQAEIAVHALEKTAVPAHPNCQCQVGGVDACSIDSDWLEHVARRVSTGWSVLRGTLAQAEAERDEALKAKKDAKRLRKQVRAVRELVRTWERAAERRSDLDDDLFDSTAADAYRSRAQDLQDVLSPGQK